MVENTVLIKKAAEYAKQNATNCQLSLQDIALHAGFSTDYFNRIFLSHTGFNVMSYVNYIRLMKATELLRCTEKSILEIALDVGYDSHEGFIKAFKKRYDLTPSEYRNQNRNTIMLWGELVDKSFAARFIHSNPDFRLVDSDFVIDYLLEKAPRRYGYFCTTIKYMGLKIAAPDGELEKGFVGIGDDRKGGYYIELMTDDFAILSNWLKRFSNVSAFYSCCEPAQVKDVLKSYGIGNTLSVTPQSFYYGDPIECHLQDGVIIRPLSFLDKAYIEKWANGRKNGYIRHLLSEKDYLDPAVLEYGVFRGDDLIAVAGCGIDEVHDFRLNNCCAIHFAEGKAVEDMYRSIFAFIVNDVMDRGLLPFDDLQHGEYARTHGNFTAADMGFITTNWRYDIVR